MYIYETAILVLPCWLVGRSCPRQTSPVEDSSRGHNQRGKDYPQVNSERRVRARISAPQAQSVLLDINGIRFPMTKDANGVWTGDSAPFDEGNHYYRLVIDGAEVPDPAAPSFSVPAVAKRHRNSRL